MSPVNKAYDSDQESIDLNELPDFGAEHNGKITSSTQVSSSTCALLDAEYAEIRTSERLGEIAEEMRLFTLNESEFPNSSFIDVEEKHAILQPPSIPFFTSNPLQMYSQDTLIWPFSENKNSFLDFSQDTVENHIKDGYLMRHFLSKRKPSALLRYLFHVMSCTKDVDLMHSTYRTLIYLMNDNNLDLHMFKDVLIAIANLGGDISKFGIDICSLSSTVIQPSNIDNSKQMKQHGVFKGNKILILEFLAFHIRHTSTYSPSELDDLLKICLAISLDPLLLDNGCTVGIVNTVASFCQSVAVLERMKKLITDIAAYCEYHHQTIVYVCTNYLSPNHRYGRRLRSALAFHQAENSLERKKTDSDSLLIDISVGDVLELVKETVHVLGDEKDSSLVLSIIMLIDVCITDEPLQSDERAKLHELCSILELELSKRRASFDDQNTQYLIYFTYHVMIKWKQKAANMTRQQTLMEMKGSYTS